MMRNISFQVDRRQVIKLGIGSLFVTLVSPLTFGQPAQGSVSNSSSTVQGVTKVDGVVSYNAGWVINLEDKAPLLEVESKKTKEHEELAKQKGGKTIDSSPQVKDKPKSVSDKVQDFVAKIKGYF